MRGTLQTKLLAVAIVFSSTANAQSRSTIWGHLFGNDAKPMVAANVILSGTLNTEAGISVLWPEDFAVVSVNPDGSFSISTDTVGAFNLIFTGLSHQILQVPLVIDSPCAIQLDIHLQPLSLPDNFRDMHVRYDWDLVEHGREASMQETSPGVFRCVISADTSVFPYRFSNTTGDYLDQALIGATADSFEYSFERTYSALVHPRNGKVEIVLTDTLPRPAPHPAFFMFHDSSSVQAQFAGLRQRFQLIRSDADSALHRHMLAGKSYRTFSYDWGSALRSLHSEFSHEKVPLLRDELLMEYMELLTVAPKQIDRAFIKRNISRVPATSLAWPYHGTLAVDVFPFHPQGKDYLRTIISRHPSHSYRARLLLGLYTAANRLHNKDDAKTLFHMLTTQYLNTPAGKDAASGPKPYSGLRVGMKFPRFTFRSLRDTIRTYSIADVAGKYALLDFWATWCAPCAYQEKFIDEASKAMDTTHCRILSVAVADTRRRVGYFQSQHYPMTWMNAIVDPSDATSFSLAYDISVGDKILLSPDGTILARGESLKGDRLQKTLAKYLSEFKKNHVNSR